jgi:outer membrane protein assembly factor BamB
MAAHERVAFAPLSDLNRAEPAAGGGLFALDAASSKVLWHTPPPKPSCLGQRGCAAAQMAPPSAIPGVVFSASMDGHIRAFAMADGKIVWDYDAAHDFTPVNRIPARGGSFSATGPTIVENMLYTTSLHHLTTPPQGTPKACPGMCCWRLGSCDSLALQIELALLPGVGRRSAGD